MSDRFMAFMTHSNLLIYDVHVSVVGRKGGKFSGAVISPLVVKSSIGMNIASAIIALIGILICIIDLAVKTTGNSENQWLSQVYEINNAAQSGLSGVLLLFSLLEFCITVSFAHFGCQRNCCANLQRSLVFVPYQVNRDATFACEPNQHFPPAYDNVVTEA
ncbi:hypothetical protein E2320_020916 [Naja naja]|nr:hypothetical protein E2320_020916 [Naja naja]